MQKTALNLKKLHPEAKIPLYATEGSVGCDFILLKKQASSPEKQRRIRTGIALGKYLQATWRSLKEEAVSRKRFNQNWRRDRL